MSQVVEPRTTPPPSTRTASTSGDVPPLENGDHLDQPTFHERYLAMPEDFRAELIQGRVYVPSPVRRTHHRPHTLITTWLGTYDVSTDSVEAAVDGTTILDEWNEPQPDCFLIIKSEHGGQTTLNEKDYVVGPPELAVEIAASTEAYDLHEKREAYEASGILEYIVVLTRMQQVQWLRLEEERYVDHPADADGVFRSVVFPGLWLDSKALFADDGPHLLKTLQAGLESDDHQAFIKASGGR